MPVVWPFMCLLALVVLAVTPPGDDVLAKALFDDYDAKTHAVSDTEVMESIEATSTPAGWVVRAVTHSKEGSASAGVTLALLDAKTLESLDTASVSAPGSNATGARRR